MKAKAIATAAQVAAKGIHEEKKHLRIQQVKRKRLLIIISGIVLLVTLLFISGSMFTNCMARIKEVGIFSALGFTRSYIIKMFIGRALLVVLVGGILGSLIGTLVGVIATVVFWQVNLFTLGMFSGTLAVILICGIIAGIFPAVIALHRDPARVLSRGQEL
jgi:putative ABC transport system permease protein